MIDCSKRTIHCMRRELLLEIRTDTLFLEGRVRVHVDVFALVHHGHKECERRNIVGKLLEGCTRSVRCMLR